MGVPRDDLKMMERFVNSPEWALMTAAIKAEVQQQDVRNRTLPVQGVYIDGKPVESVQVGQGRVLAWCQFLTLPTRIIEGIKIAIAQEERKQAELAQTEEKTHA